MPTGDYTSSVSNLQCQKCIDNFTLMVACRSGVGALVLINKVAFLLGAVAALIGYFLCKWSTSQVDSAFYPVWDVEMSVSFWVEYCVVQGGP